MIANVKKILKEKTFKNSYYLCWASKEVILLFK